MSSAILNSEADCGLTRSFASALWFSLAIPGTVSLSRLMRVRDRAHGALERRRRFGIAMRVGQDAIFRQSSINGYFRARTVTRIDRVDEKI